MEQEVKLEKEYSFSDYHVCGNCKHFCWSDTKTSKCGLKGFDTKVDKGACGQFVIIKKPHHINEIRSIYGDEYKSVYSSGIIEGDVFFQTIFIGSNGKYKPRVVTSKGDIIEVQDNYVELLKEGREKKNIKEDDKFVFFEYNGIKYKFKIGELFYSDQYNINTVNNDVFYFLRQKRCSKDIYIEIKNKIKQYFDHHNPYEYDIQVVNCIDTYILRTLNKTFYQIEMGKEDTGKSTLQKVLSKLQFNGIFGGKGSVALNVRLGHYLGCNINQDEFDKTQKDEKKIFIGVANTGLYGDGTYSICDMSKKSLKHQITILHTFSKKIWSTNSLSGFDNSFLSRCYLLTTTRQGRSLKDINDLSEEDVEDFQQMRNKIFTYCLYKWMEIKQSIKEVKKELEKEGVFGRKTDMNSIILGIIKHFKGDYYNEVKDHLKEKEGLKEEDRSTTKESLIFEYITDKFVKEDKIIEVSNKDIVNYLSDELNLNDDERKGLSRTIGWVFRNYDLVRRKENIKRGSKGERVYVIEKNVFLDMLKRFQYTSFFKKLVSEPVFRNGKNGKNGRSIEVSEVSEVSEDRLPNKGMEEEITETPKDIIFGYIEKNPNISIEDIVKGLKKDFDEVSKYIEVLMKEGSVIETKPGIFQVLK